MAFVAETDAAAGRLRLVGDCRMADLPALTEALARVRAAAPGVQFDLTRAGEFDIGPAWLLRVALDEARAAGGKVTIEGKPPGHFAFFDELPDAGPAAATPPKERWLIRFGRTIETRLASTITALGFGGRTLVTAGTAWMSLRRL